MLIQYSSEVEDTVNAELENAIFTRLNYYDMPFGIHKASELIAQPDIFDRYDGVLYYFDPPGLVIPPEKECVQIFGFLPLGFGYDRVTVNDEHIALLAADYLTSSGVKNIVMFYREDMIINGWHPRVQYFKHIVSSRGIRYIDFSYSRDFSELSQRIIKLVHKHGEDLAFFAFNTINAFELYKHMNEQDVWNMFCNGKVVCGDTTTFLRKFWPQDCLIDASLKDMAYLTVDILRDRFLSPNRQKGLIYMLGARAILQARDCSNEVDDIQKHQISLSSNSTVGGFV